jgi:hypothetical protein
MLDGMQRSSSLWPSYILLAVVFGAFGLASGSPGLALFTVGWVWLLWTLVVAFNQEILRNWRLAGPARWSSDRPLPTAVAAGAVAFGLPAVLGGVVWRSAILGLAYGALFGLSGVLIRRRTGQSGS